MSDIERRKKELEEKQEEDNKNSVRAEVNSLAVGDIRVGGSAGNIHISNVTHIYNALEKTTQPESEEPVEGEPPYMGLRYFDTSDADLFYGREALTRELLARVQKESFLAIVGASGSGKSSVARAGLIPAWTKENERGAIHVITPTAHPLESLAASLTRESESVTATSTLMDDLKNDSRSLRLYVKKTLGETKSLLLVDQFEETFTLCKDADERKAFIENLLSLADDEGATHVVITLRADFYAHCAEYEGLRLSLEEHQKYIGAMTADELRQAITAPAQSAGWDFQPGLVDLILQDVGTEPGALPLLSHALLETWKRRQGRTLTLKGYADAGGVKKAIAQTAESVYNKLTPAEQTIARGIFLRLTELGEGVQNTRRRVKLDELAQRTGTQDSVVKVLKTLTDARLVTTAQESAEVAHEALIREWGTLRKWLDEDRDSLRLHRHLTESAGEWQRRGKETSELYRGARLKGIQEWMKKHSDQLSSLEEKFLKASENVRWQEQLRRFNIVVTGVVLLLIIILALAGKFDNFFRPIIYQPVDMEKYWVTIPAGEFQMGTDPQSALAECQKHSNICKTTYFQNETPIHAVYVDAFEIGRHEITNRQYAQCIRSGICRTPNNIDYSRQHLDFEPATDVNWYDAQSFCKWVGGSLPTEAEWEKAARGGYMNYYGLDPVLGNINFYEWIYDYYSETYYSQSPSANPVGPENSGYRVMRGQSNINIFNSYDSLRLTFYSLSSRFNNNPANSNREVGFRCARNISPSQLVEKFGSGTATNAALTANVFIQKDALTATSLSKEDALTATSSAKKEYALTATAFAPKNGLTATAFCQPLATSTLTPITPMPTPDDPIVLFEQSLRQAAEAQTATVFLQYCQPLAAPMPTSTPTPTP